MAEVKWQARRTTDNTLVDVTADVDGLPQSAPTANAIETGGVGSGDSVIQTATVTLTNAQIKALPSTQVQVVAAPGVGQMLAPVLTVLSLDTTAGAYTGVDADSFMQLVWGNWDNDASVPVRTSVWLEQVWKGFAVMHTMSIPNVAGYESHLIGENGGQTDVDNKPLKLAAANLADFTGGNAANSLTVTVYYIVVDL